MSLEYNDLFLGSVDKIKTAIERIRHFEPKEGYCLAFSGGKDSIVVKKLMELSGVKYETHFSITTVDPPELTSYIKKYYPDVIFDRPKYNMKQLIVMKMYPPTRLARYCCEWLKEGKQSTSKCGSNTFTITGVRWAESFKRSKRKMFEFCLKDKSKKYLHPIIDWTDLEVWEFIKKFKLPYCELYDRGFKRIGCIGCPMSTHQKSELEQYPKIKNMYLSAFKEMLKERDKNGLGKLIFGKNEHTVMDWWIDYRPIDNPDQTILFE